MIAPASRRRVMSGPFAVSRMSLRVGSPNVVAMPCDVELLLHGDRHAGERPERLAARPRGVDGVRFRTCFVEATGDDGVQSHVHRLDLGDVRLEHVARGDGARGDQTSEFTGAAPRQLAVGFRSGMRHDGDPRVFRWTFRVR